MLLLLLLAFGIVVVFQALSRCIQGYQQINIYVKEEKNNIINFIKIIKKCRDIFKLSQQNKIFFYFRSKLRKKLAKYLNIIH